MNAPATIRKPAAHNNIRSVPTRIYLASGKFDRRYGQRYDAHLGSPDGEKLVTNALDVEYAACRALRARGITGPMETWRPGSATPAMFIADIAEAATWTIREDERRGPSLVKYRAWSETGPDRRPSPSSVEISLPAP
jgi:hypothetical protein